MHHPGAMVPRLPQFEAKNIPPFGSLETIKLKRLDPKFAIHVSVSVILPFFQNTYMIMHAHARMVL